MSDAVTDLVREGDRDRYIATLFAPADKRDALLALHAFDLELSRIPQLAKQQIAGEIRLQWWRDAVDGSNDHEAQANPVAAALLAAVEAHALPRDALQAMIDARGRELVVEPFADSDELLAWCDGAWASQLACACRILDCAEQGVTAGHAGRAIGVTQLLMSFAARAARGQSVVPRSILEVHGASASDVTAGWKQPGIVAALADMRALARKHLEIAEQHLPSLPSSMRPAFVLLGLVVPRLRWLEHHANEPYAAGDTPQWRKMWVMWRAARA